MSPANPTIPGRQVAEIVIAVLLILWRITDRGAERVWADWAILFSAYWIASIVARGRRHETAVPVVFIAAMMAIYLWGQLPQALVPLGLHP